MAAAAKKDDANDVTGDAPAPEGEYPVGVIVATPGEGVEVPATTWNGDKEWKVDPETGRITGPA